MNLPPLGSNWPFPSVNGERTPESVALETSKVEKQLTQYKRETLYEQVMSDPETEDAPL